MRGTRPDVDSRIKAGRWLHQQLPIRFARRIEDFLQLNHLVVCNPHIGNVLDAYLETFDAITAHREIVTPYDESQFCELIRKQNTLHGPGTQLIAEGYKEVQQMYSDIQLDDFLNTFFTSRIATRILMDNYVEMREPKPGFVGVVRQGMRPSELVRNLADPLVVLTTSVYGDAPSLEYRGNGDTRLDYIPRHVGYMLRELLKNALRATVERHKGKSSQIPPVVVELQQGDVHVIIKISDCGGGVPKHIQEKAWKYGWTTAAGDEDLTPWGEWSSGSAAQKRAKDLAGYGFGLPLTRLHAQYFGGDVFMQALPGHGTDMYLLLTHLKEGTSSTEIDDLSATLYSREQAGQLPR
ncbi:unnamed protein product [Prorocentrum cordatum]|nr:unnamed protein product [Polarella glacialis]